MDLKDSSTIAPERFAKFQSVAANRQLDLAVVLENVHDPHNIGAIMRSCDSVGVSEVFIVYSDDHKNLLRQYVGNRAASGAKKWIKISFYDSIVSCFEVVRTRYDKIYGTKLDTNSQSLYDLDMTQRCALVFGNEHTGLTEQASHLLDGNFIIPQVGMTQSLNVSVACAVTLFEAKRQRLKANMYDGTFDISNSNHALALEFFVNQHHHFVPDTQE
jgi:tRNA (guanosine-2'-O-)-methyltransferase